MKAYMVMYKHDEWCDFVHANSAREARNLFVKNWGLEGEFIDARATRASELDDLPLLGKNIVAAGYNEEWLTGQSDTCKCSLCKNK